jgi:hypothetical protein
MNIVIEFLLLLLLLRWDWFEGVMRGGGYGGGSAYLLTFPTFVIINLMLSLIFFL